MPTKQQQGQETKNKPGDSTSVETTTNQPPATTPAPLDFAADANKGMEGTDKDSYAIPFLQVLQGLSPQIETVDGAKPGLWINTITNQLFKEVQAIPCAFQRRFIRWAPRDAGGGYKGQYNPIDVELNKIEGLKRDDEGRYTIDDDELKDTRHHYVLVLTDANLWAPALISLTSTMIKKSKRWMTRISGIEMRDANKKPYTPPSFSHIYKLTTVKEENSQGSWYSPEIALVGPVTDAELYAKAKAFHDSVAAGTVVVSEPAPPAPEGDGKF